MPNNATRGKLIKFFTEIWKLNVPLPAAGGVMPLGTMLWTLSHANLLFNAGYVFVLFRKLSSYRRRAEFNAAARGILPLALRAKYLETERYFYVTVFSIFTAYLNWRLLNLQKQLYASRPAVHLGNASPFPDVARANSWNCQRGSPGAEGALSTAGPR